MQTVDTPPMYTLLVGSDYSADQIVQARDDKELRQKIQEWMDDDDPKAVFRTIHIEKNKVELVDG